MNKVLVYILLLFSFGELFPEEIISNHGDDQILDSNPELLNRGISSIFEYSKLNIDNRQDLFVNLVGGNLIYKRSDFYLFDIGLPLIIEFTYNTSSTFIGRYGNNWQFSYNIRYVDNNLNKSILLIDNNDKSILFDNDNGAYRCFYPAYNLIKSNDSVSIEDFRNNFFKDNDYVKYNFFSNLHNYITSIEDRNLNRALFIYNSDKQLVSIKLPSGRSANLYYNNNLLERIAIPEFGDIKYYYDDFNNLIKVEYPNKEEIKYNYESNCNFLSQIITKKDTFSIEYRDNFYVDKFYKNSSQYYYEMKYDLFKRKNTLRDKFNKEIIVEYDSLYRVKKVYKFGKVYKSLIWDSLNRITKYINPINEEFNYVYSEKGILTDYDNLKIRSIKYILDSSYQSIKRISINNSIIEYELDKNSNILNIFRNNVQIKSYKYDNTGQLIDFNYLNDSIRFLYDGLGKFKRLIINNDLEFSLKYNIYNDLENITEIDQFNINASYDYYNNKISILNNYDFKKKDILFNNKNMIDSIQINNIIDRYFYDNSDRVSKISNNSPYSITFEYNSDSLVLINSPIGKITYNFDYNNYINTISSKFKTTLKFDIFNRLISKSIKDNIFYEINYNPAGKIVKLSFPESNSIDITYDDFDRITRIDKAAGNDYQYGWDDYNRLVSFKENSSNYKFQYVENGYSLVNPSGMTFFVINNHNYQEVTAHNNNYRIYFDRYNRLEQYLVNNIQKLKLEYKGNNIFKKTINDNWELSYHYNNNFLLAEIIENGKLISKYDYDEFDRLRSLETKVFDSRILYDEFNRIKSVTSKSGSSINFNYTANDLTININGNDFYYNFLEDQLIMASNKNFDKLLINLNKNLLPIKISSPEGVFADLDYNHFNKISSIIDPYNFKNMINYNDEERIIGIINKNNLSRTFAYNSDGLINNYIDFDGSSFIIQYINGQNISKIISSYGDTAYYNYGGNFKINKFRNFDGSTSNFEFDDYDNLTRLYDLSDTISYSYNFNRKLSHISYNNKFRVNYNYSNNNLLNEVVFNDTLAFNFYYDSHNLLQSIELNQNQILNLNRDLNRNIVFKETWKSNPTTYQFNEFKQILQQNSFFTQKFNYDKLGRLIQVLNTDGSKESYIYDLNSRLVDKNDLLGNNFSFAYDKMYNIKLMIRNVLDSIKYNYNDLNQLISTSLNNNNFFEAEYSNGKLSKVNSNSLNLNLKWLDNDKRNLLVSNHSFNDTVKFDGLTRLVKNHSNYGYGKLGSTKYIDNHFVEYDKYLRIIKDETTSINNLTYDSTKIYPSTIIYKDDSFSLDYNISNKISLIKSKLDTFKIYINNYNNYIEINKNQNSFLDFSLNEKGDYAYFIKGLNNLKKITNGFTKYGFDSNEFQITYNINKNIKTLNLGQSTLASFNFDEKSNLILSEDAEGNLIQYSYFNNLINEIDFSNGKFIKFEYDLLGRIKNSHSNSEIADSINISFFSNSLEGKIIKLFDNYFEIFNENNQIKVLKNNKSSNLFKFLKDSSGFSFNFMNKIIRFNLDQSIDNNIFKIITDKYKQIIQFGEENYYINNEINHFGKLITTTINTDTVIRNKFDVLGRIIESKLLDFNNLLEYDNFNRLKSTSIISDNYQYTYSGGKFSINNVEFSFNSNKSINRIIDNQDTAYLFYDYQDRLSNFRDKVQNVKLYYNSLGELSAIISEDTTFIINFKLDSIDGSIIINEDQNIFDLYVMKNKDNQFPIIKYDLTNDDIEYVLRNASGHPIFFIDNEQNYFRIDTINLIGSPIQQLKSFRYYFKNYFFIKELNLFINDGIIVNPNNLISYNQNLKLSLNNLRTISQIEIFDIEKKANNLEHEFVINQNDLINTIDPFENRFMDIINKNKSEFIIDELNRLFNDFKVFNIDLIMNSELKPDILKSAQIENYLPDINNIILNNEPELHFNPILPDELYDSTLLNSLRSNRIRNPKLKAEKKDKIIQLFNLMELCEVDTNFVLYKKLSLFKNLYDLPPIIYPDNIIELGLLTPDFNELNYFIDPNSLIKNLGTRKKSEFSQENILDTIFNYLYLKEKNNFLDFNKPYFVYNDIIYNDKLTDNSLPISLDILNNIPIINNSNIIRVVFDPYPINYLPSKHLYRNNYVKLLGIENIFNRKTKYIFEKSYEELK